ncbi:HK97 gp10 family phage protein [Kiloniella antarctica]|uniref:HK97 gp10 family phage protein n=1 Tax=Kiloniella antarctica TaxID=1550907 RepID=A0ABW5BNZ9_9PROT
MSAKANNKRQAARLRRLLQRAPDEITKEVKEALVEAAERVREDAIKRAPYPELKRALADKQAIGIQSNGFKVVMGFRTKTQLKRSKIGYEPAWVEYGTKPHSLKRRDNSVKVKKRKVKGSGTGGRTGSGGQHPGTPAQPFMTPAAEMNRKENRRRVGEAINNAVKKMVRNG